MSPRTGRRRAPEREPTGARTAAGIFLLALALRLLFWQATPDADWPYPAVYKGDAAVWLDYAAALQADRPYQLGLPLRPPGNAWLVAWLWNGRTGGIDVLRGLWCAIGAAAVALLYLAARRGFGPRPATVAGIACAGSYGLMALSVSPNNETPYLLLVAASLALWPSLIERPRAPALAGWAALGGLGCLVRAEHALFAAVATLVLAAVWLRRERARRNTVLGRLAAVAAIAVAVLAPWHAEAWSEARRLNRGPAELPPGTERAMEAVEAAVAGIEWEPEAEWRRDQLPAFTRRTAAAFVAATAAVRGRERITDGDFVVLEEAFGTVPEPLPEQFFVAIYGPLNFYLANHRDAEGGFSRGPLNRRPPLAGGAGLYPAPLVAGLPPPDLALTYPPHLEAVNDGYRLGWDWIASEPLGFARLAGRKLAIFAQGATLGLTGWNLPLGLGGVRRAVDLATPAGGLLVWLWRLALAALAAAGLAAARGRWLAAAPWLVFLGAQITVTIAFFGYARTGATVIPVLALLAGLAADRWLPRREPAAHAGPWQRPAAIAALLLLAAELGRFAAPPGITVDGRPVAGADPFPAHQHTTRRIEAEWPGR